jgi:hypothetical protein
MAQKKALSRNGRDKGQRLGKYSVANRFFQGISWYANGALDQTRSNGYRRTMAVITVKGWWFTKPSAMVANAPVSFRRNRINRFTGRSFEDE